MSHSNTQKIVLIEGTPRSGKTTLIKKLVKKMKKQVSGFITQEVRKNKTRIGFDVIDIKSGKTFPLARKGKLRNHPKVGSYNVFVEDFNKYLQHTQFNSNIVIVDEIGKMELLSTQFQKLIKTFIETKSLIATIPVYESTIVKLLKNQNNSHLFVITRPNRDQMTKNIIEFLEEFGWA